jgi:hypothetical protein
MLRFAQHDKKGECASFSGTGDRKTSSDFDHDHRHVVMLRRVSDEALHVFAS